jgi:hypothetical protein
MRIKIAFMCIKLHINVTFSTHPLFSKHKVRIMFHAMAGVSGVVDEAQTSGPQHVLEL